MSVEIIIQNQVINFPSSSESPNWAPAIIQFAQAVEQALATVTGDYDIAPQIFNIDTANPGIAIDITPLEFPNSQVRSVVITYAVVRTTTTDQVFEGGTLELLYDNSKPSGNKWDLANTHQGDALIEFFISDSGQVNFTTEAISGLNHTGFITFRAISTLNS